MEDGRKAPPRYRIEPLALYRKYGFDEVLYEGADEAGAYYKLLKRLPPSRLLR